MAGQLAAATLQDVPPIWWGGPRRLATPVILFDEHGDQERTRIIFNGLAFLVEIYGAESRHVVGLPLDSVLAALSCTARGVN